MASLKAKKSVKKRCGTSLFVTIQAWIEVEGWKKVKPIFMEIFKVVNKFLDDFLAL